MMARDAAHDAFVHTLETITAMVKADPAFPVPTAQRVLKAHVRSIGDVEAFAAAHNLGAPVLLARFGYAYIDIPFGVIVYRVTSEGA